MMACMGVSSCITPVASLSIGLLWTGFQGAACPHSVAVLLPKLHMLFIIL